MEEEGGLARGLVIEHFSCAQLEVLRRCAVSSGGGFFLFRKCAFFRAGINWSGTHKRRRKEVGFDLEVKFLNYEPGWLLRGLEVFTLLIRPVLFES